MKDQRVTMDHQARLVPQALQETPVDLMLPNFLKSLETKTKDLARLMTPTEPVWFPSRVSKC